MRKTVHTNGQQYRFPRKNSDINGMVTNTADEKGIQEKPFLTVSTG
jgi:hypothetical protein